MNKKVLVTGGSGFLGAGLVNALVRRGYTVRVFDNNFRGHDRRVQEVRDQIEIARATSAMLPPRCWAAAQGVDVLCHLAYVNGTRFFYEKPDLVLDVAVKVHGQRPGRQPCGGRCARAPTGLPRRSTTIRRACRPTSRCR